MKKRKVKKTPIVILLVIIGLALSAWYLATPDNKVMEESKNNSTKKATEKEIKVKKMSLVAVGDCLIHGAVYMDASVGNNSYDFSEMIENIKPLINDYDLKYYNQETIIGGKSLGVSHYPRFNSPEEIGDNMVDLGFNLVS